MGFIWLGMLFMITGKVAVVKANDCWQTCFSLHYTVGLCEVTVSQSEADNVMNEVLNHGKGQLSCSGLTLKLLNVTITTPGNLYSITGLFGVIYGNMDSSQKSTAQSCLTNAEIFNDIVFRPDYYTSPLKGSYWADRASLTSYQDSICYSINGSFMCASPSPSTFLPSCSTPSPSPVSPVTAYSTATAVTNASEPTTVTSEPTTVTPSVFLHFVPMDFVPIKRVSLGGTVQLFCAVLGTASDIVMSWSKNDRTFNLDYSQGSLNYTKALVLTIESVTTKDAGLYVCDVSSSIGFMKRSLKLEVQVSKKVEMEMSLKHQKFHSDLLNSSSPRYKALAEEFKQQVAYVFNNIDGPQRIEVYRFKNGSIVVEFLISISRVLSTPQDNPPDLVKQVNTIMIEQVKKGSFGNYSVSLDSLFFKAKPPPPTKIIVIDKGTMFIKLQWKSPVNSESYQIKKYILKYKKSTESVFKMTGKMDRNVFAKEIENLEKNTKYDFEMYSENAVGQGNPSTFSVTTLSVNPVIANDGQEFTFKKGETAVIFCIGSSEKRPEKVEWTSERPSSAEMYRNETLKTKSIYMTFKDVKEENAGIYKCRTSMKDASGEGNVTLIVIVPVEVKLNATLNETFSEDLKNERTPKYKRLKTKFEDELSKFFVNMPGFVGIEVIGFVNGSVKVRFRVIVEVKVGEAEQLGKPTRTKVDVTTRIIKKVQTSDGNIGGGLFIKKNSITSDAPPPSPLNLTLTEIHETMAHLKWLQPEDADAFSIHSYTITLKKFGQAWQEKVTTQHIQLDSRIEELKDDTRYTVKVFAKGSGGKGLDSDIEEFKTKELQLNLTWLWVGLALLLGLVILAFLVYHYRKKQIDHRRDANDNRTDQRRTPILCNKDPKSVTLHSYRNNAFALSSVDFDSLELMPGKWLEIPREILTLGDTLGAGQFGLVKKGVLEQDNGSLTCAVKMLKKSAGEEEARDLMNELEIMASVGTHANLVNLIGACIHDGPLLVVLEFAVGGSLLSYIKTNVLIVGDGHEASSLSDQKKLEIGLDIAKGMQHLAHVKCVHRDLAARNVLLTADHRAKIADFGMSRDVYERGFYEKQSKGKLPVRWMSPEAIQQMMFTTKGDVWSYGVVLWEIESGGKRPYGDLRMRELIDNLKKGQRLARPSRCIQGVYDVMLDCWQMDPDKRPTFDKICDNMEELLYHFGG